MTATSPSPVTPVPAATADWVDPAAMLRDPHGTSARRRERAPVVRVRAITRYLPPTFRACRAVEPDQEPSSPAAPGSGATMARPLGAPPMLRKDDPDHA